MEEMTVEEIQQSVTAAFHSVDLINAVIAGDQMADESAEEKQDAVSRNVEHLKIMVAKEWFAEALSADQTTAMNTCISAGEGYTA